MGKETRCVGRAADGQGGHVTAQSFSFSAPPNALHITVVRAARVRAPPSLAKEGGFTLLAEVRVAHRLFLTTDTAVPQEALGRTKLPRSCGRPGGANKYESRRSRQKLH